MRCVFIAGNQGDAFISQIFAGSHGAVSVRCNAYLFYNVIIVTVTIYVQQSDKTSRNAEITNRMRK